jgi:uncharacterized protein
VCVKIDLSKIEGEPIGFAETVRLEADRLDPTRVIGPIAVRFEGMVRPTGGHFLASGRSRAEGRLSCGRCLKPVDWRSDSSFDVELVPAETGPVDPELALDERDLDVVYLDEPAFELEDLAVEQVLLELPMRVLCDEACAGLCPRCGADRNQDGACRCEPETDPRWAALKDLGDGFKVD